MHLFFFFFFETLSVCFLVRFNKDGVYIFDASKLYETHKKCQSKAQQSCVAGKTVIIGNLTLILILLFLRCLFKI